MKICITGASDSGKTAVALELAKQLRKKNISFSGVASPAYFTGGRKTEYFVRSLRTGTEKFLLKKSPAGPVPGGKGFVFADRILARSFNRKVVIVDELGPIEADGAGFLKRVKALASKKGVVLIFTTRPGLVPVFSAMFGKVSVIDMDKSGSASALKRILCLLSA